MTPTTREITELWAVEAVCDGQWSVQAPVCMDRKNAELHLGMFREGEQLRITRWVPDDSLEAQVEALRCALHEIAEEWAGSECGVPVYAQEAYAIGLAKKMYQLAVEGLKGQS